MNWCTPSYTIISLNFAWGFLKFILTYFASLVCWGIYRYFYNANFDSDISLKPSEERSLVGFRKTLVGTCLKSIYLSLIALSQLFLCVVVWNVVCSSAADVQPYWIERARTYIIFYVSGLSLCLLLHFMNPFFETFFLLRESLEKCLFVQSKTRSGFVQVLGAVLAQISQKEDFRDKSESKACSDLPLLKVQIRDGKTRYVCHNQVTYIYLESKSDFLQCDQSEVHLFLNRKKLLQNGLGLDEVERLSKVFGENTIGLEIPSIFKAFVRELLHPLNILRLGSLWQGVFLRFYTWALAWGTMIIITTLKTLKIIILNQENIKKALQSYIGRPILVLRNGEKIKVSSNSLVPGDLIYLSQGMTAPCDILVASGRVLVNEAFITGESTPVMKIQVEQEAISRVPVHLPKGENGVQAKPVLCKNTCSTLDSIGPDLLKTGPSTEDNPETLQKENIPLNSILRQRLVLMGTKVLASIPYSDSSEEAIGIVFRTGIYSSYGQLLYKIVHSFSSPGFHSVSNVRYIRNLRGFWMLMLSSACAAILYQNHLLGWSTGSFFFAVGTFIQLLPLWAPTCIQFSLNKSVERLEQLFSLSTAFPMDIPLAGKLKVLCMDKTGTLTTNTMSFIGVVGTLKGSNSYFGCLSQSPADISYCCFSPEAYRNSDLRKSSFLDQGTGSFDIQIHNEQAWETSTISYDEEDPLIDKTNEIFSQFGPTESPYLPPIIHPGSLSQEDLIYLGISCCHNIVPQFSEKGVHLFGNDIEKALFTSTNAKIKLLKERRFISLSGKETSSPDSVDTLSEYPIEVLRINEFDWNSLCTSVVIHHRILDRYFVFCKGSLDVLSDLSPEKRESGPSSACTLYPGDPFLDEDQELVDAFSSTAELNRERLNRFSVLARLEGQQGRFSQRNGHRIVDGYSKLGFYVMAISFKEIKDAALIDALLNKPRSNVSRKTLESDLTIIGYLLFQNELRKSTQKFVETIKKSGIKPVILTGDSAFTAISTARKAGVIPPNSPVVIGDISTDLTGRETVVWQTATGDYNRVIPCNKIYDSSEYSSLVVTSRAMMHLRSQKYSRPSSRETPSRNPTPQSKLALLRSLFALEKRLSTCKIDHDTLLDLVFDRIRIFARCNPEHKRVVVSDYRRKGIVTGMVGDGVNDLPAFKMADVSISVHEGHFELKQLTETRKNKESENSLYREGLNSPYSENSPMALAFSSFSIEADNIMRVLDLIREGRAALVTTISLFLFLLSQGVFYSFYKNVLFAVAQANLPSMSYVFIDVVLVFPTIWLMILSKPKKHLYPGRPTGALLGPRTVLSFLSLSGTSFLFYSIVMSRLMNAPWMVPSLGHNSGIPVERWVQRQDNFEASTTFLWMGIQLSSMSAILSFGGLFRERVTRNKRLISWVIFCHAFLLILCLTGPNALTCLFRVNCTDQADRLWEVRIFGLKLLSVAGKKFQGAGSHNLFPPAWRAEFIFWNYSSVFCMSLIYWWITSNAGTGRTKLEVSKT
ncbi:E1-E2 ATPase family protein [Cryptosporidium felis]|nr:E1-E2 ATPase family protein [Cryptosporidium felis]